MLLVLLSHSSRKQRGHEWLKRVLRDLDGLDVTLDELISVPITSITKSKPANLRRL